MAPIRNYKPPSVGPVFYEKRIKERNLVTGTVTEDNFLIECAKLSHEGPDGGPGPQDDLDGERFINSPARHSTWNGYLRNPEMDQDCLIVKKELGNGNFEDVEIRVAGQDFWATTEAYGFGIYLVKHYLKYRFGYDVQVIPFPVIVTTFGPCDEDNVQKALLFVPKKDKTNGWTKDPMELRLDRVFACAWATWAHNEIPSSGKMFEGKILHMESNGTIYFAHEKSLHKNLEELFANPKFTPERLALKSSWSGVKTGAKVQLNMKDTYVVLSARPEGEVDPEGGPPRPDMTWKRCVLLSMEEVDSEEALVFYVDYGYNERVPKNGIFEAQFLNEALTYIEPQVHHAYTQYIFFVKEGGMPVVKDTLVSFTRKLLFQVWDPEVRKHVSSRIVPVLGIHDGNKTVDLELVSNMYGNKYVCAKVPFKLVH